jgi:hypothetical protein
MPTLAMARAGETSEQARRDHPDHPVAHFKGISRAMDEAWDESANSAVRRTVRVTPEVEVSSRVCQGQRVWLVLGRRGETIFGQRGYRLGSRIFAQCNT